MPAEVEYFGIRHHGPGSARRLLESLDSLQPAEVLVEGPVDLSHLMPLLADRDMVPPVALLAYPSGEPERSVFWPFSVFSPEYQAIVWAVSRQVPCRFIDLPVHWRFQDDGLVTTVANGEPAGSAQGDADEQQRTAEVSGHEGGTQHVSPPVPADDDGDDDDAAASTGRPPLGPGGKEVPASPLDSIERDPIGALAFAAGYEDGESWWQHVIEENPEPGPIFLAVADAMRALREDVPPPQREEAAREAHMRLEIAKSRKAAAGPVAVVCGAWHVPALMGKHSAKDDKALLKGVAKRKISATWTPWTAPRLAISSGYGAGVAAPGWNRHLWETPQAEQCTRWVARTARCLREKGHGVSTASLIETERLAMSLAAIRGRPRPGFEELVDATVSCLCFGNPRLWQSISTDLLIGSEVGSIPDDVPLAPLLEDLQRQQKAARLKPEALDRELSVDLRTDSGLLRSTLLHRLNALDVPWGKLDDPGRSRGTFRERWVLSWEPEYAVALVENLVYGASIAQAAAGRIVARLESARGLGALSQLVFEALTAQLPAAAARVSQALEARAGQATDGLEMLSALPPIADVLRYGRARQVDMGQMAVLFERIAIQAAINLHHTARGLDDEAAEALRSAIHAADRAIQLTESSASESWVEALQAVVADDGATPLVAGQSARLLYEAEHLDSEEAVRLLDRKLSPGTSTAAAAGFFEGFLDGAGSRLIHDAALRGCVSDWLLSLEEDEFVESLPLFRRVFSNMDKMERRRLLDAALGREAEQAGFELATQADELWEPHMQRVVNLLAGRKSDG